MSFADFTKGSRPAAEPSPEPSETQMKGFSRFGGGSEPAGPPTPGPTEKLQDEVLTAVRQQNENVEQALSGVKPGSPVSQAMRVLAKPTNFVAGQFVGFANLMKPGIQEQLNPAKQWFPDIAYHDILNYYTWSPELVEEKVLAAGYSPTLASAVRETYRLGRAGVGLIAGYYLDPLQGVQMGQLTRASEAAYKAGNLGNLERNLVQYNIPYTNVRLAEVPMKPISNAASAAATKTVSTIQKIPGGKAALEAGEKAAQVARDFVQSMDYRTGNPEVDLAASRHAGLKRGDQQFIYERFYQPLAAKRFTDSENALLAHTIENTPNIAPELPETVLQAAPNLGKDEATVTKAMRDVLQKRAADLGVSLPDGRIDDLVEAGVMIKRENAIDLLERGQAGLIKAEDLADSVIEGYLVHKKSPAAEKLAIKDPKMAAAYEEAALARETMRTARGSYLSDFDTGKFSRTIRTPLEEANQIMQEKTGIKDYFITDPIIATALKRAETRKLVRDSELLDTVSRFGVRPKNALEKAALKRQGYEAIPHPKFQGKTVIIRDGESMTRVKFQDLVFPKQIARKMSYYMIPREVGKLPAYLDSYNRVFRNTALFKLDYHAENMMENLLKNYVQGVKIEDYVDTLKVIGANPSTQIKIGGQMMSAAELNELVKKWGIQHGGQYKEQVEAALQIAKRLNAENILKRGARAAYKYSAGALIKGMRELGAKGENQTRVALFLNRLKQGYTPEMAAFEVEKFLFDFSRTTEKMDIARRFYDPFIQAAIKTGFAAPAMIGKNPAAWNAYENTLMDAFERAYQDPVTASQIRELYPEYYRIQDRIAGPLLPGNHWLALMAGVPQENERNNISPRLGSTIAFALPGGLSILNKFALWDSQQLKNSTSGTIVRSFGMFVTGTDPFNGNQIDLVKGTPDVARRFNAAVENFVFSGIALPNAKKILQSTLGMGPERGISQKAFLILHGQLGKFGQLTNLDKEFLFRMVALKSAKRSLVTQLHSTFINEMKGNSADIAYSDQSMLRSLFNITKPKSSAEVYAALMAEQAKGSRAQAAAEFLSGSLSVKDLIGIIKNIDQTTKDLNDNYVAMAENYFRMAKGMKDEQVKALQDQMRQELEQTTDRSPE